MGDEQLDYATFLVEALHSVVRRSLQLVARRGLPGDHHFYITFRTNLPGVRIPDRLRARYREQMTIVLQHEFSGLNVDERGFAVTLSFDGKPERLAIPFAAVVGFTDPSVKFGLPIPSQDAPLEAAESTPEEAAPEPQAPASVVQLDKFRKK